MVPAPACLLERVLVLVLVLEPVLQSRPSTSRRTKMPRASLRISN